MEALDGVGGREICDICDMGSDGENGLVVS